MDQHVLVLRHAFQSFIAINNASIRTAHDTCQRSNLPANFVTY